MFRRNLSVCISICLNIMGSMCVNSCCRLSSSSSLSSPIYSVSVSVYITRLILYIYYWSPIISSFFILLQIIWNWVEFVTTKRVNGWEWERWRIICMVFRYKRGTDFWFLFYKYLLRPGDITNWVLDAISIYDNITNTYTNSKTSQLYLLYIKKVWNGK